MKNSQFARIEGVLELLQKQAAEQSRQHAYGQEEAGLARDPAGAVGREPAAGDDTMQMRVMQQGGSPGVQDGEEANLRAQMFGIGGDGAQGLGRGLEENVVDHLLVLVGDRGNLYPAQ